MKQSLIGLVVCILLSSCAVSKVCHGDGVCEVTKNGVTTYEGDPQKVAEYQARAATEKRNAEELQTKIDALPRHTSEEPIRIAVLPTVGGDQELAQFASQYHEMIVSALRSNPKVQITNVEIQKNSWGPQPAAVTTLTPELIANYKKQGLDADVVLVTYVKPTERTGLVGDRGAAGVVQITVSEFVGSFSALDKFEAQSFNQLGKSVSNFAAAGIDKDGKTGSGSLKFNRDYKQDEAPAKEYVTGVLKTINERVLPKIPSVAALQKLRSERGMASSKEKVNINLQDLFKRK